ncbi:MAG TPA: hypothetical protein VHG08_12745 [Longimicrobium sp.]|nr:hypothetical protein [Longimicrobium sp.]
MIHRSLVRLCAAALLLAAGASACRNSPTDPSRPRRFTVTFLGMPADATGFSPRAVDAGRVVGVAVGGGTVWAAQWLNGSFTRVGPAAPAGCHTEPMAARGGFTVGQVICTATGVPAGPPVDVYGWAAGVAVPARLFAEPYTFVGVNGSGFIAGTINPAAQFPQAQRRAFVVVGGAATILLPPDAAASEAVGITNSSQVVVTAYRTCLQDQPRCHESSVMVWEAGAWTEVPVPRNADRAVGAAVSAQGHVAAYAFGESDQAFLYEIRRRDLDGLPIIPGTRVLLSGANSLGQVVGTGIREEPAGRLPSYGIVWGDERQYSLSERLVSAEEDWQVTSALATDDDGHVAGTAINPETGQEGAVLLTSTRR